MMGLSTLDCRYAPGYISTPLHKLTQLHDTDPLTFSLHHNQSRLFGTHFLVETLPTSTTTERCPGVAQAACVLRSSLCGLQYVTKQHDQHACALIVDA